MKTPMQELIEHLETWMLDEKDVIDNPTKYDERLVQYANQMTEVKQHFIRLCKSMLEKEKKTICKAWEDGGKNEWACSGVLTKSSQYYKRTFKTKEK